MQAHAAQTTPPAPTLRAVDNHEEPQPEKPKGEIEKLWDEIRLLRERLADKPGRGIYRAMANIFGAVQAITKDRHQLDQETGAVRFKYRGVDDVFNELHGLFSKERVFILPDTEWSESCERTTKYGKTSVHTRVRVRYYFTHEDGSQVSASGMGEASDFGDKSLGQAESYAIKQCLLKVFLIPTENDQDPDARSVEWAARSASPQPPQQQRPQAPERQPPETTQREARPQPAPAPPKPPPAQTPRTAQEVAAQLPPPRAEPKPVVAAPPQQQKSPEHLQAIQIGRELGEMAKQCKTRDEIAQLEQTGEWKTRRAELKRLHPLTARAFEQKMTSYVNGLGE